MFRVLHLARHYYPLVDDTAFPDGKRLAIAGDNKAIFSDDTPKSKLSRKLLDAIAKKALLEHSAAGHPPPLPTVQQV